MLPRRPRAERVHAPAQTWPRRGLRAPNLALPPGVPTAPEARPPPPGLVCGPTKGPGRGRVGEGPGLWELTSLGRGAGQARSGPAGLPAWVSSNGDRGAGGGLEPASRVRRALAGVSDLPKQALPQPHTSWEAWAGPCRPKVCRWGGGRPPPPSAPEGSAGAGEGQQGSQPPALGRGWSGRRRAALPGRSEPTDDPGPLQSRRTAWESEVEGRPRQRLIASSLTASPCTGCQARPAPRGLSYQPFVPAPSTICWGSSGGSWCTNRPEGPLDPAVSGPQARMGGGGRLAGSKWGPGPGNTLVSCS